MKEFPDKNEYDANQRVDELLNSFIDGELTPRERAEVEQKISDDAQVAERLRQLQKCKVLVSSLPRVDAPAEILEEIKASLETRAPSTELFEHFDERKEKKYLLTRKVLAAAAIIGFAAILATVLNTIVSTHEDAERTIVYTDNKAIPVTTRFSGRLELNTSTLIEVNSSINRAIKDNGLLAHISSNSQANENIYALTCGREGLNILLADLENIWRRFDSATLYVDTEVFGEQVVVNGVSAEQIAEIVNQENLKGCIKVAKDFAILNDMAERLPGKAIWMALNNKNPDLIAIPKPHLTGKKEDKKPATPRQVEETVYLTVVLASSE